MVEGYLSVSDLSNLVTDKYISDITKNNFSPSLDDIIKVQQFVCNNLADIVNEPSCNSLEMNLNGKDSGEIYSLGLLVDKGEDIALQIGNDQYFIKKSIIGDIFRDSNLKVHEEKHDVWVKSISIPKKEEAMVRSWYQKFFE